MTAVCNHEKEILQALIDDRPIEAFVRVSSDYVEHEVREWRTATKATVLEFLANRSGGNLRVKQLAVAINRVPLPLPLTSPPPEGTTCWAVDFASSGCVMMFVWDNTSAAHRLLRANVVHLSRENAAVTATAIAEALTPA